MGIQFAIHTYGHGDAMFFVINGIKMIMDSDFADSIIKLMALIATSYYALQGMARANDGQVGYYFMKTAAMLIVITSLLMPKADILIVDRIGGRPPEKVDNLPYAFVLPVGILEAIGAGITSMFEQVFAPVSSISFKDYGMIFGQRMVQESRNWRISNPEFASNMNTFIERCVVLEAMIGSKFTPMDVYSTDDIFELVTSNAGTFRTVDLNINRKFARLTCKDAGKALKEYMQPELNKLVAKYNNTDFGRAVADGLHIANPTFNQVLGRNIELGYKSTFGVDYSAQEIIRQNMMIHAISDFNNASDLYGYRRASDMQKSNWSVMGNLAKENLPQFLTILKALIYACFVFVVPMMILSGGIRHYLKYCIVVFSLQIWPALNAVLNLFVELYSRARLSGVVDGGISFASFNQAHDIVDTIVLMAAGLQMSIPFLSFAIVQGGVGSFVHLASTLQGASNNAASAASSELTSGNRSLDNISHDNQSMHNKSGFKTDLNPLHQQRAMQVMRSDGSIEKTFADGSSSISSGAGINTSSGTRTFTEEEGVSANMTEGYNESINSAKSMEQHYQNSRNAGISSVTDRVSHLAQRLSAGQTVNFDESTEEGRAMQHTVNHAKSLHDRDNYGWSQAAKASVNAYAKAGIGFVGGSIEGGVSADNTSSQSLEKQDSISRENNTNHNLNTLMRAATNEHYTSDDSVDHSLAQSTKASYDDMQSYSTSISQKREEADNYSQAIQSYHSKGGADRQDRTHEVEQRVMKEYGLSQSAAHQMIERGDKRVDKVWNNMLDMRVQHELEEVRASKDKVYDSASNNAASFTNEHSAKVTNQAQDGLKQQAANDGLDQGLMESRITQNKNSMANTKDNITQNANSQITATEQQNEALAKSMNKQIDQYEKDRIGQGKIARTVAKGLDKVPFTELGSNIGGMNSKQKNETYLKSDNLKQASQIENLEKNEKE